MAYARFAPDSEVSVYADGRGGFVCERCPVIGEEFRCSSAAEMVTHLLMQHRANGQRVPEDSIDELMGETDIYGAVVEVVFTDDRKSKAEINRRRDGLFQVWVSREVNGDGEYDPDVYWSPVGRDAILTDNLERARTLAEEALRSCAGS